MSHFLVLVHIHFHIRVAFQLDTFSKQVLIIYDGLVLNVFLFSTLVIAAIHNQI